MFEVSHPGKKILQVPHMQGRYSGECMIAFMDTSDVLGKTGDFLDILLYNFVNVLKSGPSEMLTYIYIASILTIF